MAAIWRRASRPILALQRIYEESAEHRWAILRLLCSYIRMNTQGQAGSGEDDGAEAEVHPQEDIAAALDAICFRSHDAEEQPEQRLDLSQCHLRGAYFAHVWSSGRQGAKLARAYLWSADLRDADLRFVDLSGARLDWADLRGADLRGALVGRADFNGVQFSDCDLQGVDLSAARGLDTPVLASAKADEMTRLPILITRPATWPAERIEFG